MDRAVEPVNGGHSPHRTNSGAKPGHGAAIADHHLPHAESCTRHRRSSLWPLAVAIASCAGSIGLVGGIVAARFVFADAPVQLPETLGSPSDDHRRLHSVSLLPGVESQLASSIAEMIDDEDVEGVTAELRKLPSATPSDWWTTGRLLRFVATKLQDRGVLAPGKRSRFLQDLTHQIAPEHLTEAQREALAQWVGMPQPWYVLTPLRGAPEFGAFDTILPPQESLDLTLPVVDGQDFHAWRPAPAEAGDVLDINARADARGPAVAFAATWIVNSKPREVWLQLGSSDAAQVWVNQKPILRTKEYRPLDYPQERIRMELPPGPSLVLVRLDRGNEPWGFALDVTDPSGWPVPLRWSGPPSADDFHTPPVNADRVHERPAPAANGRPSGSQRPPAQDPRTMRSV
jgi:hypothetical protein